MIITELDPKPAWLAQVEEKRKPITFGGLTYEPTKTYTRECLIVKDYVNLPDPTLYNELLCHEASFIDLGEAPEDYSLIINIESGKVFINTIYVLSGMVELVSLGDGSWGIESQFRQLKQNKSFVNWLIELYNFWLKEVYEKASSIGLIKNTHRLHHKSIWHLIKDGLPQGQIISKKNPN